MASKPSRGSASCKPLSLDECRSRSESYTRIIQGYRLRAVALIFYSVVPMITINTPNLQHESASE